MDLSNLGSQRMLLWLLNLVCLLLGKKLSHSTTHHKLWLMTPLNQKASWGEFRSCLKWVLPTLSMQGKDIAPPAAEHGQQSMKQEVLVRTPGTVKFRNSWAERQVTQVNCPQSKFSDPLQLRNWVKTTQRWTWNYISSWAQVEKLIDRSTIREFSLPNQGTLSGHTGRCIAHPIAQLRWAWPETIASGFPCLQNKLHLVWIFSADCLIWVHKQ